MRSPASSPKLYLLTRDRVLSCELVCLRVINVPAGFLLVMCALTAEARGYYPHSPGSKTGF